MGASGGTPGGVSPKVFKIKVIGPDFGLDLTLKWKARLFGPGFFFSLSIIKRGGKWIGRGKLLVVNDFWVGGA